MKVENDKRLVRELETGSEALGLSPSADDKNRLLSLISLLAKWNRAYNLTAITEPRQMLHKHVLDSLSLQPFLHGRRILDAGTGGGFPGLPLAIINPQREFVLLDSHAKKLRFVDQAAAELGIGNVTTVHARLESYEPATPFDSITSRAFTSLDQFAGWAGHLLAADGRLLAMKGRLEDAELKAISPAWRIETRPVVVPFVDGTRHIVELRHDASRSSE